MARGGNAPYVALHSNSRPGPPAGTTMDENASGAGLAYDCDPYFRSSRDYYARRILSVTEIQRRAAWLGCQQRSCLGWRIDARGNAKLFQLLYVPLLEMKFCAAFAAWSKEHNPLELHSTATC